MALWNFTIDDASPYISYDPFVDGSALTTSWQTWYTDSLYNTIPNDIGRGISYHVTSLQGANVTFQFFGTGVSFFGTSNTTFGVTIDKISQGLVNSTTSPLLFSKYGLVEGLHSVTLSIQNPLSNSSQLALDYASVSSPLRSDENSPSPIFYDNSNTASLEYSGTWTDGTMDGVPNITISAPFKQTTSQGATVSLSFGNATAVAVKGMTGLANGLYSVSIDGNTRNYNGSSIWTVPDALLFFRAGLDPTSTHRINITNLSDDTRLCLNTITVYQMESRNQPSTPPKKPRSPSSTRSSVNIGVIIGPIIGVLALCLIGGIFWYCCRRRRRAAKPTTPQTYIPRPFMRSRKPGDAVASTVTASAPSVTSPSVPFSDTSIASDTGLLNGAGGYLQPNRKHSDHSISYSEMAARKRLTRSTVCGNVWPPSLPTPALSQTSMTFVDSTPSGSEHYVPRVGSSPTQAFNTSEPIPLSPRPLPVIPVPSYDAALEAGHLSPREVKSMSSVMSAPHDSYDIAPPQYER